MDIRIWFGIFFILFALAITIWGGKRFVNSYLKAYGGEEKFNYKRWKIVFVSQIILVAIGFMVDSLDTIWGPIIMFIALIGRPILTFTWCKKK